MTNSLDKSLPISINEPYAGPGSAPKRWGRMDTLSRLAVSTVGRILASAGLLDSETAKASTTERVGLVAATRHGCLATDLDFIHTLKEGFAMASPLLFSYTLPNIALAEAAGHFGLTGPVYAFFSRDSMVAAEREARRWLADEAGPDIMLAGVLEMPPGRQIDECVVNFMVLTTSGNRLKTEG